MIYWQLGRSAAEVNLEQPQPRGAGRWNNEGAKVLYLGSSPSSAVLEVTLAMGPVTPDDLHLYTWILPEEAEELIDEVDILELQDGVGPWLPLDVTQNIGRKWLEQSRFGLLIPSVVVPEEVNLLVNMDHPLVKRMKIIEKRKFLFEAETRKF